MRNPMDVLKASVLTPQVIKEASRKPEEILRTLINGDDHDLRKLKALMSRSDVKGFQAFKLLEMSANHNGFSQAIGQLYLKKFILKGPQLKSLRYAVMTLQLWIHKIGSADSLKTIEVEKMLPQISPIIVVLIKRWPAYQKAKNLFDEIELNFTDNYNETAKFPDDQDVLASPFYFIHDNHVVKEVRNYVFPFIGKTLMRLSSSGEYYQTTEDFYQLALRNHFGDKKVMGACYIHSIENSFTLENIKPFISWESKESLENYLLSPQGEVVRTRFCDFCKNVTAKEALEMIHCSLIYGGFNFKENIEYKNFSLDQKADFLRPYSRDLESNSKDKQQDLLRLWINDSEWQNKSRSVSELTLLALKKRDIFSFNSRGLFVELMTVILRRIYGAEIPAAQINHDHFLSEVARRGRHYDINYPDEFRKAPLVLATLITLNECWESLKSSGVKDSPEYDRLHFFYRNVWEQIEICFIEHVVSCLPDYSTEDTYCAVKSAEACNSEKAMEILLKHDLSLQQICSLLRDIKEKNFNRPFMDLLRLKLIGAIRLIESDRDCLKTSLILSQDFVKRLSLDMFLEPALGRKSFLNLSVLLVALEEIIIGDAITDEKQGKRHLSDRDIEAIRKEIENRMSSKYKSRDEALLFCQCKLFEKNANSWKWFYGKYPLRTLSDLNAITLKKEIRSWIFNEGLPKKHLLTAWKKTPFSEVVVEVAKEYNIQFYEHPGWKKIGLKDRFKLFSPEHKEEYRHLLPSFVKNFKQLWKKETWTAEKYLAEINRLDPFSDELNKFATLAADILKK